MAPRYRLPALLLVLACLFAGCSTWRNPATGETRSSPPSYPECQRPEVARGLDQDCRRACMDRWQRLRGWPNPGACDLECGGAAERTVMVEDEACNAEKARQEGWIKD